MIINERLREYVESNGIKQSFLCNETGLSSDTISRILLSKRKITGEELLLICEALNIDPRSLMPLKAVS